MQILITPTNTSGVATSALRFKAASENDRIPQSVIDELARRGFTIQTDPVESNQVLSALPPDDKTKIWIQTDASGIPQKNGAKVWDAGTSKWVSLFTDNSVSLPKTRYGTFFTPAGASTQTVSFPSMGNDNYRISLMPTLWNGATWASPPGVFPDKYGYFIANKSDTLFTISFFGIPTGGLTWEWDIEQRRDA